MTLDRVRFELDEIITDLINKYPTKRRKIHGAVYGALNMLASEIIEVAGNYLDMEDDD